MLDDFVPSLSGLKVLDLGAGEGKNAFHLATRGVNVTAVEISSKAIANGMRQWGPSSKLGWVFADVLTFDFPENEYDVVIAYGLLHCLKSVDQISFLIEKIKNATRVNGINIVCSFNSRIALPEGAHPNFSPTLLDHRYYLEYYAQWEMLYSTDEDLHEAHPHNSIPHVHSMTRLIARKGLHVRP
jgi:2-polyprenyl-3-methyl-5-hydroxy-6-metoxy-1,4-benzoquinol methylase